MWVSRCPILRNRHAAPEAPGDLVPHPARGHAPLEVAFELPWQEGGAPEDWIFVPGDGSPPLRGGGGEGPPHTYRAAGLYEAVFTWSLPGWEVEGRVAARVDVLPPDAPPYAGFRVLTLDPRVGEPVRFTSQAWDPDGLLVSWVWSFGDGGSAAGPDALHEYAAPGPHVVRLAVTDDAGQLATAEGLLEVGPSLGPLGVTVSGPGVPLLAAAVVVLVLRARGVRRPGRK